MQPSNSQRGNLVYTDLSLDEVNGHLVWFYRHQRRLGVRSYPSVEEAYYMGKYWLSKSQRRFPDRKYRFALGELVYVARRLWKKNQQEIFVVSFATLTEAQEQVKRWEAGKGAGYVNEIVVAYRWEWVMR